MASYGPLCTEFYDLDKPEAPADAVEFYTARAKEVGGPVLEPMCGSGRFLLPMLKADVDVHGVDAAPAMLEACRRQALLQGLDAHLHLQMIEALSLPSKYRLAFVPSGSICLVSSDASLRSALESLKAHLEPGAPLLLEVIPFNGEFSDHDDPERRVVQAGPDTTLSHTCRSTRSLDGLTLTFHGTYEKHQNFCLIAREEEEIVLRLHRPSEFLGLLSECGFTESRVVVASNFVWLQESGCILVEARADA